MADDVFAVKELREIILAFPPPKPSQGSARPQIPSLLNAASGDALWLNDHLRRRIFHDLRHAQRRLVLSHYAERLDIGSKDLLALLGEPDIRPLWCYNSGIYSVVPPTELGGLLRLLQDTCSTAFVDLLQFCQTHDLHATDLKYQIRNGNLSSPDSEQIGVGRWYDEDGHSSNGPEYAYTSHLLASTRSSMREQLLRATEARKSIVIDLALFHGLDQTSARCFLHKTLETLYDYNHNYLQESSLARHSDNEIIFSPATAAVAQREQVIQYFLERVNLWLSSGAPGSASMPCLPLAANPDRQRQSADDEFAESAEAMKSVASGEKLVRIGDYGVTYRALRTLADNLLATIEESRPARLDAPRAVKVRDAAAFTSKLYEIIITDFSSDEERIVRVDPYVTLRTSLDTVRKDLGGIIEQEAFKAWEEHRQDPASRPFPESFPADAVLEAIPAAAPATQDSFYQAVLKAEIGNTNSTRHSLSQIWKSALSENESKYDADFAAAYSTRIMARLQLYSNAIDTLEPGKLRSELVELLNGHLTTDFLSGMIRLIADENGLRLCGRHVPPAMARLEANLQTDAKDLVGQDTKDEHIHAIIAVYRKECTRLKSAPPSPAQLADAKRSMREEALTSARNAKSDSDGSRAFLCIVLVLWANRNEGFMYATGRFVPRLLKTLRGKLDQAVYERLQELKDVVKSGAMSEEQRQELIGIAIADAQL